MIRLSFPSHTSRTGQIRCAAARLRGAGRGALAGLGLVAAALLGGCGDPVLDAQIAELGSEDPAVPEGPLHRPGQPCLLCHTSPGRAPRFTAAGTVYLRASAQEPAGGIEVRLIDAARRRFVAYTNCAGNFFVSSREYEPELPMWVSLAGQGLRIDMESPMNKNGDCAICHQRDKNPSSAGPVYLTDSPLPIDPAPTGSCGGTRP